MVRFQVVNSVCTSDPEVQKAIKKAFSEEERKKAWAEGWNLCLQWGRYIHDNGGIQTGYRFIWLRPDGSKQAARGQARIPSLKLARILMDTAERQGWGDYLGEDQLA